MENQYMTLWEVPHAIVTEDLNLIANQKLAMKIVGSPAVIWPVITAGVLLILWEILLVPVLKTPALIANQKPVNAIRGSNLMMQNVLKEIYEIY
jgi:hypothetical protein